MRRFEWRQFIPIPQDRESRRGDTVHYELDGNVRETEVLEAKSQKIPVDIVKGFLEI
jgi:hypothetical protein